MMDTTASPQDRAPSGRRFGCLQVLGFVVLAVVLTVIVVAVLLKVYIFPSEFKPPQLKPREEAALQVKLESLEAGAAGSTRVDPDAPLQPEAYRETDADRRVRFTEREVNALLARNTDLANRVAIDLSEDLVSARILVPVDEDAPVLGGRTVRLKAGVTFSYKEGRPIVILRGITVMGVPVPNAWLGGTKNIDLVREFGTDSGFWKVFADGVEDIRVEEGLFTITLKE